MTHAAPYPHAHDAAQEGVQGETMLCLDFAQLWPLWQTPFNNARTLLPTLEIMLGVVLFVLMAVTMALLIWLWNSRNKF